MKTVLLITMLCWFVSAFLAERQGDPLYFNRLLGGMMCFGFYGVIEAIERRK